MKKIVLLVMLLFVLGGIICFNVAWNRTEAADLVSTSMNDEIKSTIDQLIVAIGHKDIKAMKKVWSIPQDQNKAKETIKKIGINQDGSFEFYGAVYEDKGHKRITASGLMPQGNFASVTLVKQGSGYQITAIDVQ